MIAAMNGEMGGSWSPYKEFNASRVPTNIRFERLGRSVHSAFKAWEPFRTQNQAFVEAYLGPGYGATKDKRRKYINKSYQAVVAYSMLLAANRPRADIETPHNSLQPFSRIMQEAINNLLGEIHFEETLRRWVLDAYFQIGIVKVHRKDSGLVELEPNIWMDPGSPFVSNVSLDDFACDVSARNWGEVKWAGDMYRIPFRDIEEGVRIGMYDKECASYIKPNSKYETIDKNRLESFGKGEETDADEFEPMVDLADIWIASEQRSYTFPVIDHCRFHIRPKPLAVMDWTDPDNGPYHILAYNEAPENIMPVSMASLIDEMDRLINNIMRKQARRAANQKQGIIYNASGADTARRIKQSGDDELWQGDPSTVAPFATGGINASLQQFLGECITLTDDMAGNLKAILGQGPQADTATQEELIHSANNRMIGHMQTRVLGSTRKLVRSLALELWHDQFKTIAARLPVEGAPKYRFDATWRPGEREGNFLDYNFDINVFSFNWQAPGAQLSEFLNLFTNVFMPLEQQMAAQGGTMNLSLLVRKVAEMTNKPWINDFISFNGAPIEAQQPKAEINGSKKPANTTRTYNRRSSSNGVERQMRAATWQSMAAQEQNGMASPAGAA